MRDLSIRAIERGDSKDWERMRQALWPSPPGEHASEIERYFAEARILLNTSAFEGFPNTYLQAAKYGVPTVSMIVDPDGMLSEHHCGLVSGNDLNQCEQNVRRLMRGDTMYAELSQNSLQYVRTYHNKDEIVQKYEQALEAVLSEEKAK